MQNLQLFLLIVSIVCTTALVATRKRGYLAFVLSFLAIYSLGCLIAFAMLKNGVQGYVFFEFLCLPPAALLFHRLYNFDDTVVFNKTLDSILKWVSIVTWGLYLVVFAFGFFATRHM